MLADIKKEDLARSHSPPTGPSNDDSLEMAEGEGPCETEDAQSRSRASSITPGDEEKNAPAPPTPLTRQFTELGPPVKVPRLKRRGLFGQMTLVAEIENPKTYPRKMKWFITFIVAVAGATAPMGSSVFFRKWCSPS